MQHHPHALLFVEAHLDEVVAAAERAELLRPVRLAPHALADAGMLLQDPRQVFLERLGRIAPVVVLAEAHRHVAGDLSEHPIQAFLIQIISGKGKASCHHAAADVHADRRGDDGVLRWDHRADRCANAEVHVGHRRDVVVHDRQARDVDELLARLRLDLVGIDLDRDQAFADFLTDGHELV